MSKGKEDIQDMELDLSIPEVRVEVPVQESKAQNKQVKTSKSEDKEVELVNCLRAEKVCVRFIPRETGLVTNPKHVFYGGMAETAFKKLTIPLVGKGVYKNVLTDSEKNYLEYAMGLEKNALSVYLKNDNYWENYTVRLTKGDNYLDLSNPSEYIDYKVLLANKDLIAPSLEAMQNYPKATYEFVVIAENDETKSNQKTLSYTMKAYMALGKMMEDKESLRFIIETMEGRPLSNKSTLDFLQGKINTLISNDAKFFVKVVEDEFFATKVLIRECLEAGLIRKRGDFLYKAEDNSPLCNTNEDPTLHNAARFINLPKNQQLKLTLEAKLKQSKS